MRRLIINRFWTSVVNEFNRRNGITSATLPVGFHVATITDTVFLMIQNDRRLMSAYLHTVAQLGDLRFLNNQIARAIKQHFGLISARRNSNPNSNLIQSYTEFRLAG